MTTINKERLKSMTAALVDTLDGTAGTVTMEVDGVQVSVWTSSAAAVRTPTAPKAKPAQKRAPRPKRPSELAKAAQKAEPPKPAPRAKPAKPKSNGIGTTDATTVQQ